MIVCDGDSTDDLLHLITSFKLLKEQYGPVQNV